MALVICRCKKCNRIVEVDDTYDQVLCESCGKTIIVSEGVNYYKMTQADMNVFKIKGHVLKEYHGNSRIISIPNGVKAIGPDAFQGCLNLREVVIPDTVRVIAYNAFENCKNLERIKIPGSVISIQKWAFMNCRNLKEVDIQHGVQRIEDGSFKNCTDLRSITVPGSINFIHWDAFSELDHVLNVLTTYEWDRKYGKYLPRERKVSYMKEPSYPDDEQWWKYIMAVVDKEMISRHGAKILAHLPDNEKPDDEAEKWAIHEGFYDYGEYGKVFIERESINVDEASLNDRDTSIGNDYEEDYDYDEYDELDECTEEEAEENLYYYYEHFDEYDHDDEDYHMDDYVTEDTNGFMYDYYEHNSRGYDIEDDYYEDNDSGWSEYWREVIDDMGGPSWDYYFNDDYSGYEYGNADPF